MPDIDKVVLYAWSEVCSVCLRPKVLDLRAILPGNTKVGTSVSRAYRMQFPGNPAFFMFYTSYLFRFVLRWLDHSRFLNVWFVNPTADINY